MSLSIVVSLTLFGCVSTEEDDYLSGSDEEEEEEEEVPVAVPAAVPAAVTANGMYCGCYYCLCFFS